MPCQSVLYVCEYFGGPVVFDNRIWQECLTRQEGIWQDKRVSDKARECLTIRASHKDGLEWSWKSIQFFHLKPFDIHILYHIILHYHIFTLWICLGSLVAVFCFRCMCFLCSFRVPLVVSVCPSPETRKSALVGCSRRPSGFVQHTARGNVCFVFMPFISYYIILWYFMIIFWYSMIIYIFGLFINKYLFWAYSNIQ